MTDTKQLVKDLAELQVLAATDLEAAPWQTRASLTSMVQDAKERLGKLKDDYFRRVRSNTLGIFLFGDPERVAQFVEIAEKEAGVVMIQADDLYQTLADKVEPTLGAGREFGAMQLQGLHLGLNEVMKAMDIRRMELPKLQDLTAVADRVELVQYIRKLVQTAVGDDLLRLYLDRKINERAVAEQFAGKTFPVALVGVDPGEVQSLVSLFTNSNTVSVGTSEDGEVNEEYVLKQLTGLKKKIQSKKPEGETNH